MKQNYNDCLARLLKDEGGYTNNPNDSGGPTNYGITIADYRKYINKAGTATDVRNMTVDQAKAIYKPKYWDALGCDALPSGVDYMAFDYGVLAGIARPSKDLAKFKGKSPLDMVNAIHVERISFLKAISGGKNAVFLNGWLARANRVHAYSLQLAANKDNTSGPAAGAVTAGTGLGLSQYFHNHETGIIIGAILLAVLIGTVVHLYRNQGTK
jgi:lysozyme family protein